MMLLKKGLVGFLFVGFLTSAGSGCSDNEQDSGCNPEELKKQILKQEDVENKLDDDRLDAARRLAEAAASLDKAILQIREAQLSDSTTFAENRTKYAQAVENYHKAQNTYLEHLNKGMDATQAEAAAKLGDAKSAMEAASNKLLEQVSNAIKREEEREKEQTKKLEDLPNAKPETFLERLKKLESEFHYCEEEHARLNEEHKKQEMWWKEAKAKRIALDKQLEEAEKRCPKQPAKESALPDKPETGVLDQCLVGNWVSVTTTKPDGAVGRARIKMVIEKDRSATVVYDGMEPATFGTGESQVVHSWAGTATGHISASKGVIVLQSVRDSKITTTQTQYGRTTTRQSAGLGIVIMPAPSVNLYQCDERTLKIQINFFGDAVDVFSFARQ